MFQNIIKIADKKFRNNERSIKNTHHVYNPRIIHQKTKLINFKHGENKKKNFKQKSENCYLMNKKHRYVKTEYQNINKKYQHAMSKYHQETMKI